MRLAAFDEVEGDVWTISGERTKTGQKHRISSNQEALTFVEPAHEQSDNEYLFNAVRGKPMSDMAMALFMKRYGCVARPHGFRATLRTWVEEQTDTPFEVKESALGHAVDTDVIGAYKRSDRLEKRRILLSQWTVFLQN